MDISYSELEERSGIRQTTPVEQVRLAKLDGSAAIRLGRIQWYRDLTMSLPFIFADSFAVCISLLLADQVQRAAIGPGLGLGVLQYVTAVAATLLIQHVHGLYPACGLNYSIEFRRVLRTCLLLSAGLFAGVVFSNDHALAAGVFAFVASTTILLSANRPLIRHWFSQFDFWVQPVVVVGSDEAAIAMHSALNQRRSEGLRSLGLMFVPDQHWNSSNGGNQTVFLGAVSDMQAVLLTTRTTRVAVSPNMKGEWADYQTYHGIPHVSLPTKDRCQPVEKAVLHQREGFVELHCHHSITSPSAQIAKRLMDLVLVVGTSWMWIPLMLVIAVGIKLSSPGPVFYGQRRVGRYGRSFMAWKFRSMIVNADKYLEDYLAKHPELQSEWEETHKLKNDPRVTIFGALLRKTSLDELPQLLNVLFGEMSLVGPRPIIDANNYDRLYITEYPDVFELYQMVRPGITGLWQVSGRNHTTYEARILYDRIYLHNWSVMLDVFILWRTFKTAALREGAY